MLSLVLLAVGCTSEVMAPATQSAAARPESHASTPLAPHAGGTTADAAKPGADYPTPSPEVTESAASSRSRAIGQQAPDFDLKDQNYKNVTLESLKGKWVVLYFYPMADTPACTCQATEFTKLLWWFNQTGATVVGVSPGTVLDAQYFGSKYTLMFPLLADPEKTTIRKYGAWVDIKEGPAAPGMFIRSTYLIDPTGKIAWHWPEVVPQGHAQRVFERLEKIKAAEVGWAKQ